MTSSAGCINAVAAESSRWVSVVPYGVTGARLEHMFSSDVEGHAPSWPHLAGWTPIDQNATDATERVPPVCGASHPSIWLRPTAALGFGLLQAGSSAASSGWGRVITSAIISLPPKRSTVARPAAIATCTAATSPRTMIVT